MTRPGDGAGEVVLHEWEHEWKGGRSFYRVIDDGHDKAIEVGHDFASGRHWVPTGNRYGPAAELARLAAENAALKATVADLRRRLGASGGTVVNE